MPSLSLNFKIHISHSLGLLNEGYADDNRFLSNSAANKSAVDKYADECLLPVNKLLYSIILIHKGKFRLAFSISGTSLELLQEFRPDVIKSFRILAGTGCVDFLSEPYYNSLSWHYSKNEFERQAKKHQTLIKVLFGIEPKVFRNADLEYDHQLGSFLSDMGFKGLLCDDEENVLTGLNANQTYSSAVNKDFGILLRNKNLENEIIKSFTNITQKDTKSLSQKLEIYFRQELKNNSFTSLLLDYELFTTENNTQSGSHTFLELLPSLLAHNQWKFVTPVEVLQNFYPSIVCDLLVYSDTCTKDNKPLNWNQKHFKTLDKIYSIEPLVNKSNLPGAYDQWGKLQSIGHFFFKTKEEAKIKVNTVSTEFLVNSEEAYSNYKNALLDFEIRLIKNGLSEIKNRYKYAGTLNLY